MKKIMNSPFYKYYFDSENGFFARWGKTEDDDPQFSPIGPELLDIEISTICHKGCKFCYKSNVANGKTMSLSTFAHIFENVRENLLQIAFGIGDVYPEMYNIFRYCRANNVVPNVTVNGSNISDVDISNLSTLCGAVAVSNYNKEDCYGTVDRLSKAGLKQVNIHQLLSAQTYAQCLGLILDIRNKEPKLEGLNAVVFLSLKQKGRGEKFTPVNALAFEFLIDKLIEYKIPFGFDSCTAHKFLAYLDAHPELEYMRETVEPCESGLFSLYINVEGKAFPCSFTEIGAGIDVTQPLDFLKDVWYSESIVAWREKLLQCKRNCPMYKI